MAYLTNGIVNVEHYLEEAIYRFKDMYGHAALSDAHYKLNIDVYFALERGLFRGKDISLDIDLCRTRSFYGFPVIIVDSMDDRECALISSEGEYHFEIPEPRKAKPQRQPSNTPFLTGDYSLDFGLSKWLWKCVLRFIDWLNRRTGATDKPKHKTNGEQMATLAELFEGYEVNERERGVDHTLT